MSELNDYCPIIDGTVNILYHYQKIPVLGTSNLQDGSCYIDECSHSENCNIRLNDCPLFQKLNNH